MRSGRSKREHFFQRGNGFCQVSEMVRVENPDDPRQYIDVPKLVWATLTDGKTIDFT